MFHVQTEDSGPARPVISTHLFIEGTILSSQRTHYSLEEPEAVTQKRMQEQHKAMLKKLRDGLFDNLPEVQRFVPNRSTQDSAGGASTAAAGATDKPAGAASAPVPGPSGAATSALVERLKRLPGGAQAGSKPAPGNIIVSPELTEAEDVVEFEAGSEEDEPAVTFEAEADDESLSETTPLPKARPMAAFEPEDQTAQFGASQMPIAVLPQSRPASVLASIPPVQRSMPAYTIPPDLFRPRPTSEGVTLRRIPPVPVARTIADPIRTTMIRARPTRPAPLAPALKPGQTLGSGVEDSLGPEFLSQLAKLA